MQSCVADIERVLLQPSGHQADRLDLVVEGYPVPSEVFRLDLNPLRPRPNRPWSNEEDLRIARREPVPSPAIANRLVGACLATRRMVNTAAFLVGKVIPDDASVRQWVLSLPYRARFLCA
tara:strand:- start:754 stop:1113 length:360 start_codon:yes stop_codon:yes gene_type:complete